MTDKTCPKCLTVYKYPHMLKQHFTNTYHCKKTTDEIKEYFIVNKVKKNNDLYKCSKCIKDFPNLKSLKRHCKETVCGKSKLTQISTIIPNPPSSNNNNDTSNNDTSNNDITNYNYIYLIEKFNVNNKEYIYKFGKTNRECSKRLKEHGNESKVLLIIDVDNCNLVERHILNILRKTENIKQCDFGNEYFICNDKKYIISIILKNI